MPLVAASRTPSARSVSTGPGASPPRIRPPLSRSWRGQSGSPFRQRFMASRRWPISFRSCR
eukprot:565948-Alexandrium_andersonii.AAC.1